VEEYGEISRAELLHKLAIAAGTFYGTGLIGPFAERALAVVGESDVDSVNFLLPFEYVQQSYYETALSGDPVPPVVKLPGGIPRPEGELKALFEMLLEAEHEHVNAIRDLVKQLGGKPQKEGSYTFTWIDTEEMLARADSLEQSAASIYNGVIPLIESPEVRQTLGTIAQIEARHSAAILVEAGNSPASYAFEPVYHPYHALETIEKYTGPGIYEHDGE
jgi:rubrerythrin